MKQHDASVNAAPAAADKGDGIVQVLDTEDGIRFVEQLLYV